MGWDSLHVVWQPKRTIKYGMAEAKKRARRLAMVAAAEGVEPHGTGSPCADCGTPRTVLNTGIGWSDAAKTRLTFHYGACDACRSARACKRLREDPAAKLVQMGADAAARTKRPRYEGAPLSAAACTARIGALLEAQGGRCASCAHDVVLAAGSGIFMASLDRVGTAGTTTARRRCSVWGASASSTTWTLPGARS